MRIHLPNPSEYFHREELWFEQVELSLYHARKAWQKIRAQERYQSDPENDYPWISFGQTKKIEEAIEKVDPDREECQEISIVIDEL